MRIRRRGDQLWIDIDLHNLEPDTAAANELRLRRVDATSPAFIVIEFPPQHVSEQVFDAGPLSWPVDSRCAGPTRLVFQVPAAVETIALTDQALLAWSAYALVVSSAAVPRGVVPSPPTAPAAPGALQTAIELPWHLILSPPADAGWAHASAPVVHEGLAELWHTRMGTVLPDGTVDPRAAPPVLRALWEPDGGLVTTASSPFPMSLGPPDRAQIVRATSDYTIPGYLPDPVDVDWLMLTSLGASMSVHGAWNAPPAVLSLTGWRHRTSFGRDQWVQVVERGYLLPFGHPASVVRTVTRVAEPGPSGARTGFLRVREVILVSRPVREYPGFAQRLGGRGFPFTAVTALTTQTPVLDPRIPFVPALGTRAFVPQVNGSPFLFQFAGTDQAGRRVTFDAPAVFLDSVGAFRENDVAQVRAAYNALASEDPIRRRPMKAQPVAYAPSTEAGDTDAETHAVTFVAQRPAGGVADDAFAARDQPRCHPEIASAAVRLAAVDVIAGAGSAPVEAHLDERYLQAGFGGANLGEVFLTLATPVSLALPRDQSSLVDPGLDIVAVSRRLGPVGGNLDTLATGLIDVPAMLAAAPVQPKIFGALTLSSIVSAIAIPPAGQPVVGAVSIRSAAQSAAQPARARLAARSAPSPQFATRLSFEPQLRSDPLEIISFPPGAYMRVSVSYDLGSRSPQPDDFRLNVVILNAEPWDLAQDLPVPDSGPRVPTSRAFTLRLLGKAFPVIEVDFGKLILTAQVGRDIKIELSILDIRFTGVLNFINLLKNAGKDAISSSQPKSPWGLVLGANLEYLRIGASFTLPDVPAGPLNIKNAKFAAFLSVPYFFVPGNTRPLSITFAFAERANPFLIAVYVWGGGGYVQITLDVRGVQALEIGLEFGIVVQLGQGGPVSGSIEVMAGFYFQLERNRLTGATEVTLTAYVRARGQVKLLGIVTITLELYMGLSYRAIPGMPGKLVGQVTVQLTVSVLFFSASVAATFERQFSGGPGADPTFLDQMPGQKLWDDYVTSFAPIGA